jgi:hypothetical protein
MSSAPIVPPEGQDTEQYAEGCEQQWAREDSVVSGVTVSNGRPRSQRIRARRRVDLVTPRYWERNADAETPWASSQTPVRRRVK